MLLQNELVHAAAHHRDIKKVDNVFQMPGMAAGVVGGCINARGLQGSGGNDFCLVLFCQKDDIICLEGRMYTLSCVGSQIQFLRAHQFQ